MSCPDCGQDHKDQIEKFPVGTILKFNEYSGYGMGRVTGHAEDGRAIVRMTNGSVHTIHRLQEAVEDMIPPLPDYKTLVDTVNNLALSLSIIATNAAEALDAHQKGILALAKQMEQIAASITELEMRFDQQQGDGK